MPGYIDIPVPEKSGTDVFLNATQLAYVSLIKIAGGLLEIYGGLPVAYYKSDDQRHWFRQFV